MDRDGEILARFEREGEAWVRNQLELGRFGSRKSRLARSWLASRERADHIRKAMEDTNHKRVMEVISKYQLAIAAIVGLLGVVFGVLAYLRD